jgi:hypothetical protein
LFDCRIPEDVTQEMLRMYNDAVALPDIVSAQYVRLMGYLADKEKKNVREEILKKVTNSCSEALREKQKVSMINCTI